VKDRPEKIYLLISQKRFIIFSSLDAKGKRRFPFVYEESP
jgi:hypothetical protein